MFILGISCFYHDSAAVLIKDGLVIAAVEEERFTRKKHDFDFPTNSIRYCLKEANITAKELNCIVFYEKPFLKFERILKTILSTFPKSRKLFQESTLYWLKERLWIKATIKEGLHYDGDVFFIEHHLSHAASSFLPSPFEKAIIITIDGVGEWATTTIGVGNKNKIDIKKQINFPHSIGLLYSAFTAFLGFKVNEGEYKVMGMAPYGRPKYIDKIHKIIKFGNNGSFNLDMNYLSYHYDQSKSFGKKFVSLFGPPRKPEESEKLNPYYADIAASIQIVLEEAMIKIVNSAHKKYGIKNLCLAGGVALNSVVNGKILRETPIEELFIQPQAGDGGGALGSALYIYNSILNKKRKYIQEHTSYGPKYEENEIEKFLNKNKIKYERLDEESLLKKAVKFLIEGKVIGWFQGKMEWGPRALGNRSILADPRRNDMKHIVNSKIKFREPFRPFAASILAEKSSEWFNNIPNIEKAYPLRFMLLVVDVKKEKRSIVPAITHINGTTRPQLVVEKDNPRYYHLIKEFDQLTGVPMLLNTSFNLKGEPIVCSPEDAMTTFVKSGLDALILENFLIIK